MKKKSVQFCCLLTSVLLLAKGYPVLANDMGMFVDNNVGFQQNADTDISYENEDIFGDGSENVETNENTEFSSGIQQADAGTASENIYGYFFYEIDDDGYIDITEYAGKDTNIVIPEEINGRHVGRIGRYAFKDNKNITSIELPAYLYSIGYGAFEGCENLQTVDSIGITEIGNYAFYGCENLKNISFSGITDIGDYAFAECKNIGELDLSSTVSIGTGAFYNAGSIYKVNFSSDKLSIADGAFAGCTSFKEIILPDNIDCIGKMAFGYKPNEKYHMQYTDSSFSKQDDFDKDEEISIHCGNGSEGNVYAVRNEIPFTLHSFKEELVKAATETEAGELRTVCDICGQIKDRTEIPHIKECTLSTDRFVYNGSVQRPNVTVLDSKNNIIPPEYYDISYNADSIEPGTYRVTLNFKGNYSGTKSIDYSIADNKANITAENLSVIVGSKNKKLKVKVTGEYNGLSYKSSNSKIVSVSADGRITAKKIGSATITITAGATERHDAVTKKITVKVLPKETSITSVSKAGKGSLKLTWKAISGIDGYIVYRSTDKYAIGDKVKILQGSKNTSYVDSSLKNGKKYYYQVRTYKTVNGKRYYGDYSDTKGATTQSITVIKQFGGAYNLNGNGYGVRLAISQGTDPAYEDIPNGGICARITVAIRIDRGGVSYSEGYLVKKGGNNYTISGSSLSGGKVKMAKNGLTISGISGGRGKYTLTERYRS